MTGCTMTDGAIQHVARIATPPHQPNQRVHTEAYPEQPDMAYTLTIALGVSVLLSSSG
jgi:hypothetical protein